MIINGTDSFKALNNMTSSWQDIREKRDKLLNDADIAINKLQDAGNDTQSYRNYRQALRDIPQSHSNPEDVIWPQKPA